MSDRRQLDVNDIREMHEPFDNGCCSKCGIEDCDVMLLLAEVERLTEARSWDTEDLLAEVERLRRWKSEATLVLNQWDEVYLSLDRPWNLGESKAQGAQVAVEDLLSTNRRLTAEVERLTNDVTQWRADYERQSREVERLRAVQAVRALHSAPPVQWTPTCAECTKDSPCATLRAIDAALGGEQE